jgi:uroporphyrinogen decarboxylase
MRQAGRYLEGYKEVRQKYSVLEICKKPEICELVTLMPVKELGVDAAVMFADIMLPLEGMGIKFRIEENVGPIIENPIRTVGDAERLVDFDAQRDVPYVLEAIRRVKSKLAGSDHALIGFSGAPFTIASYIVEGQPTRDFTKTKKMMYDDPPAWELLMGKLGAMISDYLCAQIKEGVEAIQLFDSWVGALSAADYETYVARHSKAILERVKGDHPSTPRIHFGTNTLHLLSTMKEKAGGDIFSIDWRIPIRTAREILGSSIGIQGNLDPAVLLSETRNGFIAERTQKVLDDNGGSSGHIFNLGHGILQQTPVENAKHVVKYVHEKS